MRALLYDGSLKLRSAYPRPHRREGESLIRVAHGAANMTIADVVLFVGIKAEKVYEGIRQSRRESRGAKHEMAPLELVALRFICCVGFSLFRPRREIVAACGLSAEATLVGVPAGA